MNLRIDPEFKDYLGALSEEARLALEALLRAEGCRDALVVWPQPEGGAILLDGHNRLEICERLGRTYRTVECPASVTDRESAVAWIIQNQRGRRNMTQDQLDYLCGKVFNTEKRSPGGAGGNRFTVVQRCQNDTAVQGGRTAEKLAREFGISASTVNRHGKFAEKIDAIAAEHGAEAKIEILAGRKKVSDFIPQPETNGKEEQQNATASKSSAPADDEQQEVSDHAPQPEPSAKEEDAPPEPETEEAPPTPVTSSGTKPPIKDTRDMTDSECVQWMAKNMPITVDCGARPGPVHIADGISDNLADPEEVRQHDSSCMKHICQLDYHIALLPSAVERDALSAERREMVKKRLSRHVDALQTLIATL